MPSALEAGAPGRCAARPTASAPTTPIAFQTRRRLGVLPVLGGPAQHEPAARRRVIARHQLRDRAAHRVADDDRRRERRAARSAAAASAGAVGRAGTAPAGAARGRGHGGRSRARGSRPRPARRRLPHQLRSALAIQPCSSITGGPSPPLSRRNSSPRPGTVERPRRRHLERRDRRRSAGCASAAMVHSGTGRAAPTIKRMAVVIASDLGKDIAGEPLLRGISFKLERRDRMTLSGRNGAGKTTLLRMLAGEASIDFGELVLAKGAKVALHDQRPPRERGLSLRDYVLSGARELVAIEQRAVDARAGDGGAAPTTRRRSAATREAQARLEHAGGYGWRERALATLHGLGFRDDADLDRSLRHVLRRRADARLARPGARRRPRSAAARRADQPPRHRVARVARAAPREPRRGDRAGRPRPLVPGGGRNLGARARGRPGQVLRRAVARVAAARRPRASWRSAARSSASRPRSSASSGS